MFMLDMKMGRIVFIVAHIVMMIGCVMVVAVVAKMPMATVMLKTIALSVATVQNLA
jgi:hypothetical protein